MKKISELIVNLEIQNIVGNTDTDISSICFDSRKVTEGSLFVAIKGNMDDGSKFIEDASKNGAKAIVCDTLYQNKDEKITYIQVKDSRIALGKIAQNFYDNPSQKLKLVGITGTNGKTTTATLLFRLFRSLGYHTALLSTVENKIDEETFDTTHTTPDPITLASFLSLAQSRGCTHAFMECSSHAIHQKRIEGLHFSGALFTNLTHDHLDYHKTPDEYAAAKKMLFDNLDESAFAIANHDDEKSEYMLSETRARKYFFSMKDSESDFIGKRKMQSLEGLILSINRNEVHTKLVGNFNSYNILGVFAVATLLGISENETISSIALLDPPTGRLEFIKSGSGIYGVVDYAHTPDALLNVLGTLRELAEENVKIITVVGCGGDRDKTKRSVMGNIACELSDFVFFTSDNPRSEDTNAILKDITVSLSSETKNYECITDRAKAIASACAYANKGDIILVAGKGHEQYQIFSDRTVHFSDMEELKKNFTKNP